MAFLIIVGGLSRDTSTRFETSRISAAVLSFHDRLVSGGAKVVMTRIGADGLEVDWIPAGADPEIEPIRNSFLLPRPAETDAGSTIEDNEEIPVEVETSAMNAGDVIKFAEWREKLGR